MRRTESGAEYGATTLELFYDLVFVLAVTQVSHQAVGFLGRRRGGVGSPAAAAAVELRLFGDFTPSGA